MTKFMEDAQSNDEDDPFFLVFVFGSLVTPQEMVIEHDTMNLN